MTANSSVLAPVSSLNLMTNVRWIATIPLSVLDPSKFGTLALNLVSFNIPEITVSTDYVNYMGYQVEIPTGVRNQNKEITFEYMLSSDWNQYIALNSWLSASGAETGVGLTQIAPTSPMNTGLTFTGKNPLATQVTPLSYAVPIRVMMLSEFLNPVAEIVFENAWIKAMGAIELDYQSPDDEPVKNNFTVAYNLMTVTQITATS